MFTSDSITLAIPACPECGRPAIHIVEKQPVFAEIRITDADGCAEYTGETEVTGDSRVPEWDKEGNSSLWCKEGHEWLSRVEY